jgi:phosphomannomutase / phosphoglucomutase
MEMADLGQKNMMGTKKLAGLAGNSPAVGQKRGSSLTALTVSVLGMVFIVFALAGVVHYSLQGAWSDKNLDLQTRVSAKGVARNIASQIGLYQRLLQEAARDVRLVALLKLGDKAGLRKQEQELLRRIPDAKYIRLLPVEWDELDTGAGHKLSYASLAMLRGVEKSRRVSAAEVHQFRTKQQHIALAAPVLKGGKGPVAGVIHLSLPMDIIMKGVADSGAQAGYISIRQLAGGDPLQLAANKPGVSGVKKSSGGINIPGSIWSVVHMTGPSGADWSENIVFYGVLMIGMGIIALVVLLLTSRFRQGLKSDQESIHILVERLLLGRADSNQKARIAELQVTLDHLVQMMHGIKSQTAAQSAVADAMNRKAQGLPQASVEQAIEAVTEQAGGNYLPKPIFRNYDIRGVVGQELTADVVYQLGRAIGSAAYDQGQQTVIVARDGRKSGPELATALCRGLMDSGRDVLDIGMVPTPMLYFATHFLGSSSGVVVTGSHNPPEYNGLKIVIAGEILSGDDIMALRERVARGDLLEGQGSRTEQDLLADYQNRVAEELHIARPLKVVLDCGNGVAGVVGPSLLQMLGCQVTGMFCEVDGDFPNHHPDPSRPENLQALAEAVRAQQADIGIAMDGDGDRIGVVDSQGKIIWPDRLLMLFAIDLLIRQPGADIIYDVKSSRHLAGQILSNGGRPLMWKSGHSLIKARMKETGALLAGELSGHIFFKERWYGFDDGLYACARLLEILAADPRSSAEVFADLPEGVSTPELTMALQEDEGAQLVSRLAETGDLQGAKIINIDGVRAEFEYGWGLVRASNTMPALTFRFEAEDMNGLKRVQEIFREQLLAIDPELQLPF